MYLYLNRLLLQLFAVTAGHTAAFVLRPLTGTVIDGIGNGTGNVGGYFDVGIRGGDGAGRGRGLADRLASHELF